MLTRSGAACRVMYAGEVRPEIADHLGEAGLRTPAVEGPHHRVERLAPIQYPLPASPMM